MSIKNSKRVQCAGTACNKCFKKSLSLFLIIGQLLFVFFLRNYSKEIAKIFTVLTKILPGCLFFSFCTCMRLTKHSVGLVTRNRHTFNYGMLLEILVAGKKNSQSMFSMIRYIVGIEYGEAN